MSTAIFTFEVHKPYLEGGAHSTAQSKATGGRVVGRARWPAQGRFRVRRAALHFSSTRNTLDTFRAFFDARQGRYDSFLFAPRLETFHLVTAEALGTGDGSEDEFALDSKFIDASTLVVYVDAVDTGGSGWSLTGNNTAPIVDFVTPPGAGEVITATYERYFPCNFDQDDFSLDPIHFGTTDATSVIKLSTLTWSQLRPGSHLV